ncbi:hypothetical protein [Lacinutrix algicola]|uniref:hypothetical protein n=1 Tax=Lacinutrix algicola TaxID=342954 RepID=UPI0006E2CB17|nr:hypothetical protein [Lacinutrix algicola]
MRILTLIVISLFFVSCSNDDDDIALDSNVLSEYMKNRITEMGSVIACAASAENDSNTILTFYYPETGATDVRFYETETATVNKFEYSKYKRVVMESDAFFNGYLGLFTRQTSTEKWIVVTYELNNEIKISNPIRTKQIEKATVWNAAITIDLEEALMPHFSWEANAIGDNAIYFQVVSNINDDLVSGTYTYENNFKFYDVSNVVLNITEGFPELENNLNYNFTLMDVSLDNWVNLVSQKSF